MRVYVDTSALVKRYVQEANSAAFDTFVEDGQQELLISPLTVTEFHSVMRRRLRMGDLDANFLLRTHQLFARELQATVWRMQAMPESAFADAALWLDELTSPLATLDALHLACAHSYRCSHLATSDRQLARAAQSSGLSIHDFSSTPHA